MRREEILLGKEMDRHAAGQPKRDLKQNEVESNIRGYWLMAQKDQGINPKKEAKVNPRKGRERVRTQTKNYQCFKRMYDRGWITQARPLPLHKRKAIISLDAQEAVIQAVHHGSGTFHLGTQRKTQVLSDHS